MSRLPRWTGTALLAGVLAACGGGQAHPALFSTDWTDDGGISIGHVWDRVGSSTIAPSADVAVGVSGHTDKLIGLPLGGGTKWTFAHPLDARPIVTGGVVVASGGGEAFALDAKTGSVIWRRPTGGVPLLGAGDDGSVTVLTFRKSGGTGSTLLAVAHDGSVVQQIETDRPLGVPAVLGRLAFVPWAGQYVSVIDLSTGDEVARVTLREQTTRAWTQAGSLWFGQNSYLRFDAHIRDASRGKATSVNLPMRELPGTPKLMPPGDPLGPVAGAEDKVHLYARPTGTGDGAAIDSGRWYATYFRLAMGFGTDKGKLAWVHLHATNFMGGAASSGGVVLCDEQGKITTLDAKTGGVLSEADLGEQLESCTVSIDGLAASGTPADVKPLAQQLAEAVTADDQQLVVAQKLLLRELATVEDDTATKTLVDLASDPRTSPDLLADARTALANRRNGASYMEAALAKHYDYLKDVLRSPPVGPIAQALGAMKEKAAAPLLAAHLLDTADTDDDVKQAAAALAVVASPDQLAALRQFFAMYRATAENDDIASAVVSVGQALLTLDDGARVADAAKDDATVSYAKERLQALLAAQPPAAATPAQATDPNKKKK
ncbi:MAG TPA: PQQ-binding-like beta-propeller repeat protein [Polyangiaceae bacterium]|nr:PQQ-binding-like beta-propeller repeat protein [Polyangiaceae bacterium]